MEILLQMYKNVQLMQQAAFAIIKDDRSFILHKNRRPVRERFVSTRG